MAPAPFSSHKNRSHGKPGRFPHGAPPSSSHVSSNNIIDLLDDDISPSQINFPTLAEQQLGSTQLEPVKNSKKGGHQSQPAKMKHLTCQDREMPQSETHPMDEVVPQGSDAPRQQRAPSNGRSLSQQYRRKGNQKGNPPQQRRRQNIYNRETEHELRKRISELERQLGDATGELKSQTTAWEAEKLEWSSFMEEYSTHVQQINALFEKMSRFRSAKIDYGLVDDQNISEFFLDGQSNAEDSGGESVSTVRAQATVGIPLEYALTDSSISRVDDGFEELGEKSTEDADDELSEDLASNEFSKVLLPDACRGRDFLKRASDGNPKPRKLGGASNNKYRPQAMYDELPSPNTPPSDVIEELRAFSSSPTNHVREKTASMTPIKSGNLTTVRPSEGLENRQPLARGASEAKGNMTNAHLNNRVRRMNDLEVYSAEKRSKGANRTPLSQNHENSLTNATSLSLSRDKVIQPPRERAETMTMATPMQPVVSSSPSMPTASRPIDIICHLSDVKFLSLPADFDHRGYHSDSISRKKICGVKEYSPRKVSKVLIEGLHKDITLLDVIGAIRGGPVAKSSLYPDTHNHDKTQTAIICFVQPEHANAFLKFYANTRLTVKSCMATVRSSGHYVMESYPLFYSICRNTTTRAVQVVGLPNAWDEKYLAEYLLGKANRYLQQKTCIYNEHMQPAASIDEVFVKIWYDRDDGGWFFHFSAIEWAALIEETIRYCIRSGSPLRNIPGSVRVLTDTRFSTIYWPDPCDRPLVTTEYISLI